MTKTFPVAEIFGPTIQGEGVATGQPTYFVRFGGCNDRCTWCDSMHAVLPEKVKLLPKLSASEIERDLRNLTPHPHNYFSRRVVLSGGNPLLYDLQPVVNVLNRGEIHVETQGNYFKPWVVDVHTLCISPKPPSSGNATNFTDLICFLEDVAHTVALRERIPRIFFKVVIFDGADLHYAEQVQRLINKRTIQKLIPSLASEKFYVSLGTEAGISGGLLMEQYAEMVPILADSGLEDYVFLPQVHVLAWGHKLGV